MPDSMLGAKNVRVKKTVIAGRDMRGLLGTGNVLHQNVLQGCVQFVKNHKAF